MTKYRYWFLLLSTLVWLPAFADNFWQEHTIGWHWYQNLDNNSSVESLSASQDPIQAVEALQQQVKYTLDQAILNPTPENIRGYIALQNQLSAQANRFTQAWQAVLLS